METDALSWRVFVEVVDFAAFAIASDAGYDFTLGVSSLPARHLLVEISRTLSVYVLRTILDYPARFLPFPEA